MKNFIFKVFAFILIIIVIDLSYGFICDTMHSHAKSGGMAKRQYVAMTCKDQVVMFGSSRMAHHYNSCIISDSIGKPCFNAGQDGNGIIFSYGLLKMMLKHHKPDLIMYDVYRFDYCSDDNSKYVNLLKPYYRYDDDIKSIMKEISQTEPLKMKSSLYQYNSLFLKLLGSNLREDKDSLKGFLPLSGSMEYDAPYEEEDVVVDDLKIKYLNLFIQTCKEQNIPLAFFISPYYGAPQTNKFSVIKEICERNNVPLYDYFSCGLSKRKDLFEDRSHMNKFGADAYTQMILLNIKQHLKQ